MRFQILLLSVGVDHVAMSVGCGNSRALMVGIPPTLR